MCESVSSADSPVKNSIGFPVAAAMRDRISKEIRTLPDSYNEIVRWLSLNPLRKGGPSGRECRETLLSAACLNPLRKGGPSGLSMCVSARVSG